MSGIKVFYSLRSIAFCEFLETFTPENQKKIREFLECELFDAVNFELLSNTLHVQLIAFGPEFTKIFSYPEMIDVIQIQIRFTEDNGVLIVPDDFLSPNKKSFTFEEYVQFLKKHFDISDRDPNEKIDRDC